jgi:hypothetical protein
LMSRVVCSVSNKSEIAICNPPPWKYIFETRDCHFKLRSQYPLDPTYSCNSSQVIFRHGFSAGFHGYALKLTVFSPFISVSGNPPSVYGLFCVRYVARVKSVDYIPFQSQHTQSHTTHCQHIFILFRQFDSHRFLILAPSTNSSLQSEEKIHMGL